MRLISLELESKLHEKGLWPRSRIAWAALYVLALDLLLFAVQWLTRHVSPSMSASLGGWVTFLSALAIVLLAIAGFRWLRSQLLWRLRNRLIVTYVFIGVIPVFLLVVISLITLYLLAGQFASFVVTSDITTHLHSMEAANRTIAHHLATHISGSGKLDADVLGHARPRRPEWSRRQVCVWYRNQQKPDCAGPEGAAGFDSPSFITGDFRDIVRDHGTLYLRTATVLAPESLRVILSEPLDKDFVEKIAGDLGLIAVYGTQTATASPNTSSTTAEQQSASKPYLAFENGKRAQTFSAGTIPPPSSTLDHMITFPIPLQVVDWATGERQRAGALAEVETRPSVLYARLFAALGDYARGVEYILLSIAIVFAIIELLALVVGTKLTRSITSAVDQLYQATKHINRGDFSHRIPVQSSDQLSTLANSFNSMTTSIEKLIQEQKEKQRLEGELAIAQEVQAQLFPRQATELESLEVHGFCRPARTVSGDYYDFLTASSHKLILAVGDISGKGISAALLMATIHSAVRAYSVESLPQMREPVGVGALAGAARVMAAWPEGVEISPGALLGLLNHQLYESTPPEKYATLFLAVYDGRLHRLTYSNGGHLPPLLIAQDGGVRRLEAGGTVVGLFDNMTYDEDSVDMHPGEIFLAYSDGVSEPENEFGEFGEERLIDLVRENRRLPLVQISQTVTQAVDDWIGDQEQPDDITLVLARAR